MRSDWNCAVLRHPIHLFPRGWPMKHTKNCLSHFLKLKRRF